jgi:seryl-tRNA synthetase
MDTKTTLTEQTPRTSVIDAAAPPIDDSAGNIDKVRDILFGGQMRDYERRFQRLEGRLTQEISELKDDVRKRLAALEQFMTQESASLADRITKEHDERTDATRDLAHEAREAAKAFEKKTGQLDDQIGRVQRDLRQQLLDLQQRMSDDLREKIDDVLARLTRESSELRNDKTDRASLAALLTEMAMRLNGDIRSLTPGDEVGV